MSGGLYYQRLAISEGAYQQRITDLCDLLGLRWFHSGDSRRDSCKGYPDLTIAGLGGVLWLEVKKENGRTSSHQSDWMTMLNVSGQRAFIVRPSDWHKVEYLLRELAALPARSTP
jgi:hypothetical protein